jgi:uncharacterized membrane protein YccF (DUF307 family)
MRVLLNILWLLFSGLWLAVTYALAGVVMCLLIITIPFGIASFRLAGFVLWPFGRGLVQKPTSGAGALIGNVIWLIFFGLVSAIMHIVFGILLCVTIIGIPLGLGPLGKEVVSRDDPRFASATVAF